MTKKDPFPGASKLFAEHPEAWGLVGYGWGHQRSSEGRTCVLHVSGNDAVHLDVIAVSHTKPGEKYKWETRKAV